MAGGIRKLLHIHRDPDWQQHGCHFYYQCRCGARRVRRAYTNMYGPVEPGWPPLQDRHGVAFNDSGWQKAPVSP